jgi:hypothetical protein
MGFFTTRERAELGKSAELRTQGKVRELVRRDFAPPPRRRPTTTDHELTGHVGTLMQRVAETSLQEIDDLIMELKRRREKLLNESARVQREILEYAKLSQSTMQSTKIITESLAHWNRLPEAPHLSDPRLEDIAEEEQRVGEAEAFAQPIVDERALAEEIEGPPVSDSPAPEPQRPRTDDV